MLTQEFREPGHKNQASPIQDKGCDRGAWFIFAETALRLENHLGAVFFMIVKYPIGIACLFQWKPVGYNLGRIEFPGGDLLEQLRHIMDNGA